jgi:hypothetical protein
VVEHHKVKPTDLVRVGGGNWHRSKKVLEQLRAKGILSVKRRKDIQRDSESYYSSNTQTGEAMKKLKPTKPPSEEYSRFEQLARQVIAVPKSELDKREAAYQRDRKKDAKKRKAA